MTVRVFNFASFASFAGIFLLATTSSAAVLMVGPHESLKMPSAAAKIAKSGDTIRIAPGTYKDCAIWGASNLTIEGTGAGVVMTQKSCGGKAIFVIKGNDTTVSDITFSHAKVPDGNGAGIRQIGKNLTVENSKFIQNQMGILTDPSPDSTIIIRNSEFTQNGSCYPRCPKNVYMHALYVGKSALLQVEDSTFTDQHDGHYVKSRASRTEIVGSTIKDGTSGTGSYEIDIPNGGNVLIKGNTLEKGKKADTAVAITIGEEGLKNVTNDITITGNTYVNDSGRKSTFVRNLTGVAPVLSGNKLSGKPLPSLLVNGVAKAAKQNTLAADMLAPDADILFDACASASGVASRTCSDPDGAMSDAELATVAAAGRVSAVPEPASLAIFGGALFGFFGLAGLRRRGSRRRA